jgi:hypothetical protein
LLGALKSACWIAQKFHVEWRATGSHQKALFLTIGEPRLEKSSRPAASLESRSRVRNEREPFHDIEKHDAFDYKSSHS